MFNVFIISAILGLIQPFEVRASVVRPLENVNFFLNDNNDNLMADESMIYPIAIKENVGKNEDCPTMDNLIGEGGEILVNTTKILTGSIHAFYSVFIDKTSCQNLRGFRCFLRKYHEFGKTLIEVGEKISYFKANLLNGIKIFQDYFGRCKQKGENIAPKQKKIM